ncbi:hypothetical protein Avi_9873 (plasmid) [Allorhizobium ampelinum S4]|uniref:Uncharacterized protein n=1 Tax=Allorhizobium ampelinum (strain ATCC BAA-846 / DSM 112012 / S4) TaxID=311402 RepID=B9K639_ALLAM|nr:hypothetical protein Avi_9873 [Allorhizobium ampelinum S4]
MHGAQSAKEGRGYRFFACEGERAALLFPSSSKQDTEGVTVDLPTRKGSSGGHLSYRRDDSENSGERNDAARNGGDVDPELIAGFAALEFAQLFVGVELQNASGICVLEPLFANGVEGSVRSQHEPYVAGQSDDCWNENIHDDDTQK